MRFSRYQSVANGKKDNSVRNKFKGKKKHKRLDAICEKAYNRSHIRALQAGPSEVNNGGSEMELRRSNRSRRAPMLLDSSPMPPKKRRKVEKSIYSSTQKVSATQLQRGVPPSCSRDLDEQNAAWGLRLRSRVKSESSSRREKGQPVHRGKRKLFDELDGLQNGMFTENNNKVELVGERSTVVKSKRPGRIKASKVADIDEQKIDLGSGMEDGDEERNKVLDETYDAAALPLEIKVDHQSEVGLEGSFGASKLAKKEDDAVQRDSDLEKCHSNGVVEKEGDCIESESLNFDLINYQVGNNTQVDSGTVGQAKDVASPHKPLEDETCETLKGKYNTSATAGSKPLGRRCGLCGGGTDGKPPKILLLDVGGSDNESCSMSSASVERPNYDLLDGFGDHSGWLGRLLGPINDRFGIAGIWVHQQCAVWSPEVYFAGLGCLKNVRAALYRGRMLKCTRCRRRGATIGCRVDRCPRTYHLACARARDCIFDHRKFLIACTDHRHLFQPHGVQNARRLKKIKAKKLKMELRKISSDACRKDVEAEERWLENCGEDEEFVKRERKRLHRDLLRMAPTYIGGSSPAAEEFQGWESVAGLKDVIQCMKEVVVLPLLYPEFFNNLGLAPPRGVLLHGYPGTGKTLVLRALVGSLSRGDRKIAYFARKGADCLGKYVGDAERQLRLLFQVAEKHQPSIILFDEIDGLAPCRTKQQDQTHISVVSTLLALMDGLKSRGSVIVIGTTNRPDSVDTALRRPGRFDREIFFPLPSAEDREAILSLHTQKWPKPVAGSILKWVAKRTVGFAGADLQALCTQAVMVALRRSFPLQEILSAAETGNTISKCRVPSFFVEEKDWLQALSCAPPPCSRRESGISLNDVACSLLKIHFVPYLLQPLARLLVSLHMDDRIWLPLNLSKASTVLKNTIISVLHSREVQSDSWWLHVDGLLQEVDVANEIEKNLLLATVMVEESNICGSDVIQVEDEEGGSKNSSSNSQFMGTRPGLLQMMPHEPCNKSGFHLLFCGNPRSGQRHLASCLLQFFVGNIDLWKIDLSSISHEGHGDLVNGLRNILARCAGAKLCLLYMPAIELWAIETKDVSEYSCEPSPVKQPQPARKIYYGVQSELNKAPELCSSPDAVGTLSQTATRKASYLWNSFLEQVESIRVNSSMIILATSEIPFPSLPNRIKDFFGDEILSCSLPVSFAHKLPRFSVDLDGKFDLCKVINSFAAKLSKDLAVHFVQSHRGGNHIPFEGKAYDMVQGDVDGVIPAKSPNSSSLSPVGCANKPSKGKSGLQLALSTFGYQILVYPHFAELCWVTSKLKEGPAAKTDGPWKGWPFNSCIVRPVNSDVSVPGAASSSNIKSKDYGLVRGLVAVGLSAYRGEYASLKKVCSEVRKVLEALVERISKKVHAGKDQIQFVRVLSQVAYLEDMVNSWAYALRSLDVGTADAPDISSRGKDLLENTAPQLVDARDESHPEPTTADDCCTDAFDEAAVGTVGEGGSPRALALSTFSPKHTLGSNKVNLPSPMAEAAPDTVEMLHALPAKHANGFIDGSSMFEPDGPCHCSGDEDRTEHSSPAEPNVFSSTDASTVLSGASQKPSGSTCFYHCCPECFTNLHNLLLRIINTECGFKKGSILAIEDLDDILSSLSANLHLSLNRLSPGDNIDDTTEEACSRNGKCCEQQQSSPIRGNSYQMLPKECGCHEMTVNGRGQENIAQLPQWLDLRFVFKDGVLASLETGSSDVSYHCKFEKLCLCSLIEWLVKEKKKSMI